MKINVEKEPNNIVRLDIEIDAKEAVNAYNKAVKDISKQVNIAGFRKGKAPRNIVEKHVGVDKIKHETLEALLPKIFQDAISENKLDVISQPSVESYDFEVGNELKVVAKAELRPEVELGEYKNIKVEAEEYVIAEDAFDKALDGLLQQHAKSSLVVDRAVESTDIVVMDFDGSANGEKIQGGAAENYSLDLTNSNFIKGFAEQLVGHNLNEEFDINVEFPKEYHDEKLAGQPAVFKIKIKEIKKKVLPELTDEFAQKAGPFKTVDELKMDIQKYLDATKMKEDKVRSENALFEKIISDSTVDIQETMIERESSSLLEEYKQRMASQGFDWEEIMKSKEVENLMAGLKEEATSRIKNSLVIDKIAQIEEIKVDYVDVEKKLKEVETAYRMPRAELLNQLKQNPALFNSLSQQALNEKVMTFLAENNTVELKETVKAKS